MIEPKMYVQCMTLHVPEDIVRVLSSCCFVEDAATKHINHKSSLGKIGQCSNAGIGHNKCAWWPTYNKA